MNIHPRVMGADPWINTDEALNRLIDKVILEKFPNTLDDEIPDVLDNGDNRIDAMHTIIMRLLKMKG